MYDTILKIPHSKDANRPSKHSIYPVITPVL